jgi:large subunit ribosomal protein L21
MYAVIKAGGKQHKVQAGDVLEVEFMHADGDTVTFHPVLVVDDDGKTHYGKEALQAVVTAKLLGEQKGDKVNVFKYKNKSGYSRRAGHRQLMTLIEISDVTLGAAKRSTAKKTTAKAEEAAEPADGDADDATESTGTSE